MKTKILSWAMAAGLLVAAAQTSCGDKATAKKTDNAGAIKETNTSAAVNITDVEAVRQLIADESTHFYNRDFAKWSNCYLHDQKIQWVCVEEDGTLEAYGWQQLAPFVGDYLKANPDTMKVSFQRTAWQYRQQGNQLWVTFDETKTEPKGTRIFRATRIAEKVDGRWKLVQMISIPMPGRKQA
jgi:hypothetical protein